MKIGTPCPPIAIASSGVALYTIDRMHEHDDIWREADRLRGDIVTDTFSRQYVTAIREATGHPAKRVRWVLDNPDITSPYVDYVAVEKALAFDWPVIARLTLRETVIFAHRLHLEGIDFGGWAAAHLGKNVLPARAEAYYNSRTSQRDYVQRLIKRFGGSAVALAAIEEEASRVLAA